MTWESFKFAMYLMTIIMTALIAYAGVTVGLNWWLSHTHHPIAILTGVIIAFVFGLCCIFSMLWED